jgi:hypothetical protein
MVDRDFTPDRAGDRQSVSDAISRPSFIRYTA